MSKKSTDCVVLILGASGLLGNTIYRYFFMARGFKAFGVLRSEISKQYFPLSMQCNLIPGFDVDNSSYLIDLCEKIKPNIIINCIGITKHHEFSDNPKLAISINALFPHRLADFCSSFDIRLIQFSTDCVFSGAKGMYTESDRSDATDLYGLTKYLGELPHRNSLTLRTSTIGHELNDNKGLLNWFLSQPSSVRGYKNAIFSGMPIVEIARIIELYIIPNPDLQGLYNLSGQPISKFDLLSLIAKIYEKKINIIEEYTVCIDRSLNSNKFQEETGFSPRCWPDLISNMKDFYR